MRFSEIIGQTRVKNLLVQTVRNNRVSHAQLFTGPPGSGKLALAIAYAQFISCERRQFDPEGKLKGDSCGTCPSCVKYAKLAHPDLHFFYPVSATKEVKKPLSREFVSAWRTLLISKNYLVELQEWYDAIGMENKQGIINAEDCNEMTRILSYKAYESEYKVVIIWHSDKLYHAAAPKILKILEEPPEKTLFLLICENTDHMLNTILSRTQIFKIPRFTQPDVVAYLMQHHQVSETNAHRIALLSEGDLKIAVSLVDDTQEEDQNFLTLRDWFRLCYAGNIPGLVPFIEEISKIGRERQKSLLLYGLRVFRRCTLFQHRLESLVKLEGEELDFIRKFSPFIHHNNVATLAEAFNKATYHIERNANPKILFMDLSLRVMTQLKIKA